MNHVVLPRALVDDLCRALNTVTAQLEQEARDDAGIVTRQVIEHGNSMLATAKGWLADDDAGDLLRTATRALESATDADLAALSKAEAFDLAERVGWWRDKAEARLLQRPDRHLILIHAPQNNYQYGVILRAEVRAPGTWSPVDDQHTVIAGQFAGDNDPAATIAEHVRTWIKKYPGAEIECRAEAVAKLLEGGAK